MFNNLFALFESGEIIRGILAIISMVAIIGLLAWVSIIDIIKQSIKFWKLLIAGGSVIILPAIVSMFANCWLLPVCLFGAIPLWFLLLYLNIRFNLDRFIGKADIDIITAPISALIMYSFWMFLTIDPELASIQVTAAWYNSFVYLLIGSLIYLIVHIIFICIKVFVKKETTFKRFIREKKVSVIPMLAPYCVYVAYMIMTY